MNFHAQNLFLNLNGLLWDKFQCTMSTHQKQYTARPTLNT